MLVIHQRYLFISCINGISCLYAQFIYLFKYEEVPRFGNKISNKFLSDVL